MKLVVTLVLLLSPAAFASIPDFTVANAPEAVRSSTNPKAKEFWAELVEHSKQQGRKMFEDTKKTTGLKSGDMKRKDWDCLFWRVAATFAKKVLRQNPGLQPPQFAEQLEKTSQDDDCPDQGGPGSYGVQVYNTAINQVMAGRGGWQRGQTPEPTKTPDRDELPSYAKLSAQAMQAFLAAGIAIEGAATAAANAMLPVIIIPMDMLEKLDPKKRQQPESL